MNDLTKVEHYLKNVIYRYPLKKESDEKIGQLLKSIKKRAVERNDQEEAKRVWCYEQVLAIQSNYLLAFQKMKSGLYYEAWCLLERVEINLHSLERHFQTDRDEYKLRFIETHSQQFQTLFPYKYFLSPGMIILEKTCSICEKPISIRNPCGHRVGEIYNGEMCCRIITKMKLDHLAIVETPAQKYSVLFLSDPETDESTDHYNYALVRSVINRLREPFDAWDMNWTKIRHPHSRYEHVGAHEDCPCESGNQYKECCLPKSGVLRPHLEIFFSVLPPKELPGIQYL